MGNRDTKQDEWQRLISQTKASTIYLNKKSSIALSKESNFSWPKQTHWYKTSIYLREYYKERDGIKFCKISNSNYRYFYQASQARRSTLED